MTMALAASVCFLACHPNPANHFATFAKECKSRGHTVQVLALNEVYDKFTGIDNVTSFSLKDRAERELALELVAKCRNASVVITDAGHSFDEAFGRALLAERAQQVIWLAYYDNPEAFLPKDLLSIVSRVMKACHMVLFGNKNLARDLHIDLPFEKRIGIGFYPLDQAKKIVEKRIANAESGRSDFFAQNGLEDREQKLLVYTGGCNEEYFGSAFPAFLRFLGEAVQKEDLSGYVIALQQHPRAKAQGLDRELFEKWQTAQAENTHAPALIVSSLPTEDMLALADCVLYHQTSMAASFALAGIRTMQVADQPFNDLLVRTGITSVVNNSTQLLSALKEAGKEIALPEILEGLGMRDDWADFLEFAINPHPYSTSPDAIRDLASTLGIPAEEDLVTATQREWLRAAGVERWQLSGEFTEEGMSVLRFAQAQGIFTERKPRFKNYDSALILGATTFRMESRLAYLKELWNQGICFKEIVFLTGRRPLNAQVDGYLDFCADESEAARHIWALADLPEGMRELPLFFIEVPMKEGGKRPTTKDTIIAWLEQTSTSNKALFVSDQPFCAYQGAVIEGCLPSRVAFDVVGRGVTVENEDFSDLLQIYPYAPKVILDSLTRELYQKNLNKLSAAGL